MIKHDCYGTEDARMSHWTDGDISASETASVQLCQLSPQNRTTVLYPFAELGLLCLPINSNGKEARRFRPWTRRSLLGNWACDAFGRRKLR